MEENKPKVILAHPKAFEVNGVLYEPIEHEHSRRPSSINKFVALTMAIAPMMNLESSGYQRKPPNVNIIDEYALIQQKKSNLSKWDRDCVVRIFESHYKQVKTSDNANS